MEDYSQNFRDLVVLYTKTKSLILRAEQVDPDSASNIAVFKEQRDAADHLMRVLGATYGNPPENVDPGEYIKTHFQKTNAHLYRAAFDSLDGIGLSCKLRMKEALEGINNEALSAVYPEYWKRIQEFDELDIQVTAHRNAKDIGKNTLAHLESYSKVMERLHALTQDFRQRIPLFHKWSEWHLKRIEVDKELEGISNDALTEVFPKYWEKRIELDRLVKELTNQGGDINAVKSKDQSSSHLLNEMVLAKYKRYYEIADEIGQCIPQLREWEKRNKKKEDKGFKFDLKKEAAKYVLFILLGGLIFEAAKAFLFKSDSTEKPKVAISSNSTNSPPATNLPASKSP